MIFNFYKEFSKKNVPLFVLTIISLLKIPLSKIGLPHFYGKIIDSLNAKNLSKSKQLFLILIFVWIGFQFFTLIGQYAKKIMHPKFHKHIRDSISDLIINSYSNNFQDVKAGKILSRINDIPWIFEGFLSDIRRFIVYNLVASGSIFIYLCKFNFKLAMIFLGSVLSIILVSYFYAIYVKKIVKETTYKTDDYFEQISDIFHNLLTVYTSKKNNEEKATIKKYSTRLRNVEINLSKKDHKSHCLFAILNIIIFIVLNYFTYKLYRDDKVSLPSVVSIFIINYSLLSDFNSQFEHASDLLAYAINIELIDEFLNSIKNNSVKNIDKDANNEIYYSRLSNLDFKDIQIKFVNLNYKIPQKVLYKDLSLTINSENVVILGKIGSGKSTLMKLLVKLYDNQEGDIYINDVNINNISTENMRKLILYIPQHPELFNRTLYDNLTYGLNIKDKDKFTEELFSLLKQLKLDHLVERFKNNMDKLVGKKGSRYSGGERQIIYTIKSFFSEAKVIVFDEPSTSLDKNTKQNIIQMIKLLEKTKKVVIITHDKDLIDKDYRVIQIKDQQILG